jgi:hypothetical protein
MLLAALAVFDRAPWDSRRQWIVTEVFVEGEAINLA